MGKLTVGNWDIKKPNVEGEYTTISGILHPYKVKEDGSFNTGSINGLNIEGINDEAGARELLEDIIEHYGKNDAGVPGVVKALYSVTKGIRADLGKLVNDLRVAKKSDDEISEAVASGTFGECFMSGSDTVLKESPMARARDMVSKMSPEQREMFEALLNNSK